MKRVIKVWDKLKYDQKDVKIFGKATIVLSVALAVFIVLSVLCDSEVLTDSIWVAVSFMGVLCSVLLFFIALILFLDAKIYISDLTKKGFVVPETKKECECRLSMLKREEGNSREEENIQESKIYKRHLILAIVAGVITLLATVHSFAFAKKPHLLAIMVMLIITGVLFWQSFNRFFKNEIDIDIEDSRRIRPGIIRAVVGVLIWSFIVGMGIELSNSLPCWNEHYYAQIIRYYKKENTQEYRYYMDRLPSYAEDINFISWGRACGVSFYVPQENIKDIQAYYEGIGEPYVVHTMEEDGDEFVCLCELVKEETTYFKSDDYQNCVVYEFTEYLMTNKGDYISWYAIIDTHSGEVGYGYCSTDW